MAGEGVLGGFRGWNGDDGGVLTPISVLIGVAGEVVSSPLCGDLEGVVGGFDVGG